MTDWASGPAVINETVYAAKKYLDDLLDRYESLEKTVSATTNCGWLAGNEQGFATMRNDGVGQKAIRDFLGEGWSQRTIESSLSMLAEDNTILHLERLKRREEKAREKLEEARLAGLKAE